MSKRESRLIVSKQEGKNEVVQIEFVDRNILEEGCIQQIGEEITQVINQNDNLKLLISFDHVEHLSSAALGVLITVNNKVKQKKGQLRLSNIDPQIKEVFVITNLNKLFAIHDNNEKAIKSFK